jgi:polyhydroxybutyrate depolymerase
MTYAGVTRTYQLSLPKSYDGRESDPVILNLHGLTSNIEEQNIVSNFPAFGGARGYVIVTPQALNRRTDGPNSLLTTQWDLSPTATGSANDVGFLLTLLNRVHHDVCTDTHRQYVAGVSDGAAMVMTLRCAAGNQFAALAADAGVTLGSCNKKIATPLIAFHGTADPLVPYQGHDGANSVQSAMTQLATSGGCGTTPTVTMPFPDARHLTWPCNGGMALELWAIIGGGHTWPGVTTYVDPNTARKKPNGSPAGSPYGLPALVKHQTTDVIATTLMLDFFDTHRGR